MDVPETVVDLMGSAFYGQHFQRWLKDEQASSWRVLEEREYLSKCQVASKPKASCTLRNIMAGL